MRIASPAQTPASAGPRRLARGRRRKRQHPEGGGRHVAHRLDHLIQDDRAGRGHGRRRETHAGAQPAAEQIGARDQRRAAQRNHEKHARRAAERQEERHQHGQTRRADRDDRARNRRRWPMAGRRERQRRVGPRRGERERLGDEQPAAGPPFGLVHVAVRSRSRRPRSCQSARRSRERRRRSPPGPGRESAGACRAHGADRNRSATRTLRARTPSRQPIFFPCWRVRASNRTGSSVT